MWRRVLGVAVVLLALGVAGGYAVGERTVPQPASAGVPEPVPAVSPAVPTPPSLSLTPDPSTPALEPAIPLVPEELRVRPRAAGLALSVPEGWRVSRLGDSDRWTMAIPDAPTNTYNLRVNVLVGGNASLTAAKLGRLAELQDAVANDDLSDLEITDIPDGFEATYVDIGGYLRLTVERWIAFEGQTAYAALAVTGRSVDLEGMRDLMTRVYDSAMALDRLPSRTRIQTRTRTRSSRS